MKLVIYLLLIIIVPVSFFLIFDKDDANFLKNSKVEAIEDDEFEKKEVAKEEKKEDYFPVVKFQPVKKNQAADLVIANAHASLILDVDSGTILHYDQGREKRQIASLTKMMTAILAVEKISDLEAEVVIDDEAVFCEGTKVGCPRSGYCIGTRLKVGEKVKAIDLLKAMLMNSANDAAIALGKHMAETQEGFAKMMNEKAKELGLRDSNFCTPSGLEIEGKESECYSSAYDIARIAAYATKYELIWDIMRLPTNTIITSTDGRLSHDILNTDIILDQVPNCLGAKTGFTPLAGHSLLMAATDPTKKHKIIAVVLDDPYRWQDIQKMISWAFASHEWK